MGYPTRLCGNHCRYCNQMGKLRAHSLPIAEMMTVEWGQTVMPSLLDDSISLEHTTSVFSRGSRIAATQKMRHEFVSAWRSKYLIGKWCAEFLRSMAEQKASNLFEVAL